MHVWTPGEKVNVDDRRQCVSSATQGTERERGRENVFYTSTQSTNLPSIVVVPIIAPLGTKCTHTPPFHDPRHVICTSAHETLMFCTNCAWIKLIGSSVITKCGMETWLTLLDLFLSSFVSGLLPSWLLTALVSDRRSQVDRSESSNWNVTPHTVTSTLVIKILTLQPFPLNNNNSNNDKCISYSSLRQYWCHGIGSNPRLSLPTTTNTTTPPPCMIFVVYMLVHRQEYDEDTNNNTHHILKIIQQTEKSKLKNKIEPAYRFVDYHDYLKTSQGSKKFPRWSAEPIISRKLLSLSLEKNLMKRRLWV